MWLVQVGEFAFVLLSLASQLRLINNRLAMLLLGITAISLLTTPLVLSLSLHVLKPDVGALPYSALGSGSNSSIKHSRSTISDGGEVVLGRLDQSMSDPIPEADIRKLHARNGRPTGPAMEGVAQQRDSSARQGESCSPSRRGDSQRQGMHSRRGSFSGTRHPLQP